jgi:magnesium transporter
MKISVFSIDDLIKKGDIEALKEALNSLSPFEIADLIAHKSEKDGSIIFGALPSELAAETFEYLPTRIQRSLLQFLPSMQAANLLKALTPDDRTAFLQELPRETIDELVKLLPNEQRILTLTLLGYPEGSVGRLMTPDYVAVKMEWTIEEALDHIRTYGHDSETINVIYVVDDEDKLLDEINIKEFLFISKKHKVSEISKLQFVALSVNDSDETAIQVFQKHNRVALPVVDDEKNLLGIVTIDDIFRLSNQEARKDIQKIGGMEALSEPYMDAPFLELMKKRAGWLIVFFFGGSLTGTVLVYFKDEIFKAIVLTFFLPLIISIGGNAGSQASVLVISAMTQGEVKLKDWRKIAKREILSGIVLGGILGLIGFARIIFISIFTTIYGEHWFLIGETICLSILCVVLWGTLVGAMLPLILRSFGLNPATSSSPFVSSIISVTALIIYFLIAFGMLRGTLL